MDLLDRSVPGIIVHIIMWPIIFLSVDLHHSHPLFCWGVTAGLVILSVFRFLHKLATKYFYLKIPRVWIGIFAAFSLAQACLWGIIFTFAIADSEMVSIRLLTTIAVCGMSSAFISVLTPRLWLAISSVCLLLVPAIVISYSIIHEYSMAFLLVIYLLSMILICRISNAEYCRAFDIESKLESQRLELVQLNKIDPLTLIYNRGYFNSTFEFQWNAGIRSQQEQSLVLIDVDNFKVINDNYGHLFGDDCLIKIARVIHGTARRTTDIIARFGGEEFIVLLCNTSLKEACKLAEAIRTQILAQKFTFEGKELNVTASFGVSCMIPQQKFSPSQLIDLADKALYQAKREGRNCVRFTNEQPNNTTQIVTNDE